MAAVTPHVVLVSGSLRAESTSDRLARWCAERCAQRGASTRVFLGGELEFPFYRAAGERDAKVRDFLDELVVSDGVVLVSPTYHGTVSGLLKNALDYVNDIRTPKSYLDGRPIGCVAVGLGLTGASTTLGTLRTISHALRGWPTPMGVTVCGQRPLAEDGAPADPQRAGQAVEMISHVLTMARLHARHRTADRNRRDTAEALS